MLNVLVPHPQVADKNWEGYLGCRGPPCGVRGPSPHQAPQARALVPGIEVPIISGCRNQQGLWLSETEGFWSLRHSS